MIPFPDKKYDVIEAWGFTYKSIAFQWVKQNRSGNGYFFGLGRWTRGNTEPCLHEWLNKACGSTVWNRTAVDTGAQPREGGAPDE